MNFSFSEAEAIKQKLVKLKVMINIQSPGLIRTQKFPPLKILPQESEKFNYAAAIHKTADLYVI